MPPKPVLRVLIGAPGAGKTTWRNNQRNLGKVLSLDEARAHFGWGEGDQSVTADAVAWLKDQTEQYLSQGQSVTVDSTAAKRDNRAELLAIAQRHNARAVAVVFRASQNTCLTRNNNRDRVVPSHAVKRIWDSVRRLHPNQLKREGFEYIHIEHTD